MTVAIYSNFSKDISLYKRLIQVGYTLILTYHPHVDPDAFLDKFSGFDVSDYDKIVAMSVMYRPGFSERALYVFNQMRIRFPQFKSLDLSLLDANEYFPDVKYSKQEMADFNRLSSRFGIGNTVVEYDDGSSQMVNDNHFFSDRKRLDFYMWKCNAGLDFLYVHHDGKVHPCDENDGIVLYDINKGGDFKFPKHPLICPRHDCPCLFDVYKEKIFK